MKIRKGLIGISAIAAVATVTLVSCGGSKKYNVNIEGAVAGVSFGDAATNYKVKNSAALLEQLNAVTPTKTGYTFAGWYLDAACKTKLTAETKIKDVKDDSGKYVVYAGFTINKYTVIFDYSGTNQGDVAGTGETSVGVNYKGKVEAQPIATPAKRVDGAEYTFVGWYKDANRTEVFDFENTEITGNTTIYAKWDIAVITTADEFLAYVNAKQEVNAVITADIDLTGKKIDRTKATLSNVEGALNSTGSDYQISLSKKVFGNGHKISHAEVETDVKLGAIWAGCAGGAIYDLVFEDAVVTNGVNSTANGALLFGQVNGKSAVIQDVVIDGLSFTATNGAANIAALIGQVKGAVDISIDGLVIRDAEIKQQGSTGVKYAAGLVGLFNNDVAGSFTVTDLIIDGLSITTTGERAAMIFGQTKKNASSDFEINVENAVIKGSTSGAKATAVIGDNQSKKVTYNLKNISVVDFNSVNPQNSDVQLFVLVTGSDDTYQPAAINMTNCKYRSWGVNLQGKDGTSGEMKKITPTQGEAVDAIANLAALGDNISYSVNSETHVGAYVIEINGVTYSVEVAKDPTLVKKDDLAGAAVTFTSPDANDITRDALITNTQDLTPDDPATTLDVKTMTRIASVAIPYVTAATAGKAGNALTMVLTADANIKAHDLTGAYIVSSDFYKPVIDTTAGTITGKIYFTADEITLITANPATEGYKLVQKKIKVVWFDNANEVAEEVEYIVCFQNGATVSFKEAIAAGALAKSTTDANASLTAAVDTTDATKLNVTAGQIDWATDGNYVEVTVAKAAGVDNVTESGIVLTGATKVSYSADVLTAKVKVSAKGNTTFTVKWNGATDAFTYTINVADGVTIQANPNPSQQTVITLNFDTLDKSLMHFDSSSKLDQEYTVPATATTPSYVIMTGVKVEPTRNTKTSTTDETTLETGCINTQGEVKTNQKGIKLTFTGACTVKVTFAQTGTNTGRHVKMIGITDTSYSQVGAEAINVADVANVYTFENVAAGTYALGGDNGITISEVVITYSA